jgi:predicted transposase YdaD
MAATDLLLKKLITFFPHEYAELLLKTKVQTIRPCASELLPPAEVLKADQVFEVVKTTGQKVILHVEFQARSSHRPMPQRQLAYIIRLAEEHNLPIRSIVLYIGEGAGKGDPGRHAYPHDDGEPIVYWRYDVIHLWQMAAEEILALGRPALLPLVGQAKLTDPKTTLPRVLAQIKGVADATQRSNLLELFVSLIADKGILAMARNLIIEEELLVGTPYMEWLQEMRLEELEKGRHEGLEKGIQKGRQEATLTTFQKSIVEILHARFGPSVATLTNLETTLTKIADAEVLQALLIKASLAPDLSTFQALLAQHQAPPQT